MSVLIILFAKEDQLVTLGKHNVLLGFIVNRVK